MPNIGIRMSFIATGAALALGLAAPASAATITGLYNTGVDSAGKVLAPGAAEQHYLITASSNPNVTPLPRTPTVATYSQWSANSAVGSNGSSWITPFANANGTPGKSGSVGSTNLTYDYDLTFSLGTLSAASAVISGLVQSDNFVTILLNGIALPTQPQTAPGAVAYFRKFSTFGATDAFVTGSNTLTFRVTDYGVVTGLRVSDLVGTAVPEPETWAMLIVGFGLVATQIRRRRRVGTFAIA